MTIATETNIPNTIFEEGMTETERKIAEYRHVHDIANDSDVDVSDMEFYFLMKDFE